MPVGIGGHIGEPVAQIAVGLVADDGDGDQHVAVTATNPRAIRLPACGDYLALDEAVGRGGPAASRRIMYTSGPILPSSSVATT